MTQNELKKQPRWPEVSHMCCFGKQNSWHVRYYNYCVIWLMFFFDKGKTSTQSKYNKCEIPVNQNQTRVSRYRWINKNPNDLSVSVFCLLVRFNESILCFPFTFLYCFWTGFFYWACCDFGSVSQSFHLCLLVRLADVSFLIITAKVQDMMNIIPQKTC